MESGLQILYRQIADTYELVNHILTLGLDIRWRKKTASLAAPQEGSHWLDLCSGTGEMAAELIEHGRGRPHVVAVDFSESMLRNAAVRQRRVRLTFTLASAGELPFPEQSFDGVTIAFATRNLNPSREVLVANFREVLRVLAPGQCLFNLETSQPPQWVWRTLFHAYVAVFVRPIGHLLSGSPTAYRFLAHTIPRFYSAPELSTILKEAGFVRVETRSFWGGIAALHIAYKAS